MDNQPSSIPFLIPTPSGYQFARNVERHLRKKYLPDRWGKAYDPLNPKQSLWVPTRIMRFGDTDSVATLDRHIRDADVYIFGDVYSHSTFLPEFPKREFQGHTIHMDLDKIATYDTQDRQLQSVSQKLTVSDNFDMLLAVLDATRNAVKGGKITVVTPCFPSARQDRRLGRKSLDMKRRIRALEAGGANSLVALDIHNPAAAENAVDKANLDLLSSAYTFINHLDSHPRLYARNNMVIISPDAGAKGRNKVFSSHFGTGLGIYDKDRDQTKPNTVMKKSGFPVLGLGIDDIVGKDVYAIDDMVDTFGTMLQEGVTVMRYGARSFTAIATHFIASYPARKRMQEAYDNGTLKQVIVTDSVTVSDEDWALPFLKVLDISKYHAKVIDHLNVGESVSELLQDVA